MEHLEPACTLGYTVISAHDQRVSLDRAKIAGPRSAEERLQVQRFVNVSTGPDHLRSHTLTDSDWVERLTDVELGCLERRSLPLASRTDFTPDRAEGALVVCLWGGSGSV